MIAKDFQEATATRIVDLFRKGHNRVLLADEVGLGKTIVAKTVVEKTGAWRKEMIRITWWYIFAQMQASQIRIVASLA